jgi:hypothetical protein
MFQLIAALLVKCHGTWSCAAEGLVKDQVDLVAVVPRRAITLTDFLLG